MTALPVLLRLMTLEMLLGHPTVVLTLHTTHGCLHTAEVNRHILDMQHLRLWYENLALPRAMLTNT